MGRRRTKRFRPAAVLGSRLVKMGPAGDGGMNIGGIGRTATYGPHLGKQAQTGMGKLAKSKIGIEWIWGLGWDMELWLMGESWVESWMESWIKGKRRNWMGSF